MIENDGQTNQGQSNTNPEQTAPQTVFQPVVRPELDAGASSGTEKPTTYEIHPSSQRDWHRPLGIPITEWFVAFFTLVIMASSIVYTVYAKRQWRVMNATLTEMRTAG